MATKKKSNKKSKPQLSGGAWNFGDEPNVVQSTNKITFTNTEVKRADMKALDPFGVTMIEENGKVFIVHFKTKAAAAKCYDAIDAEKLKDSEGEPWVWKVGEACFSCEALMFKD